MPRLSKLFLAAVLMTPALVWMAARPPKAGIRRMTALKQTYIVVKPETAVAVPPLLAVDGSVISPELFKGRWSVIFFGFTACPLVCPKTLSVLRAVARNPESGISSGTAQAVFVSVDPEHDTPSRMSEYLKHFDRRIIGLTGSRDAIDRFSREIGAGSVRAGSGIDHSTSLFVVNPEGRLAGILLRPADPARIVADLAALRRGYAAVNVRAGAAE